MASDDERGNGVDDEVNSSDEEGIDLMNSEGDSSEEEEEDPEEEAKIREGFIADEDDDDAERRRRRRKKKRKHRERGEFEALSDEDLDLVEQNTGVRIERPEGRKLKKLKRAGATDLESDSDNEPRAPELSNLFGEIAARNNRDKGKRRADQDDGGRHRENRIVDDFEEDDMADFIEEDSPDEDGEQSKQERAARKAEMKAARKKKVSGFALGGLNISAEAWDEIQEIFGDGHDYDEALESDDEGEKPQPTIKDVFEPSEIAERLMTDADDIIRGVDIPERTQLAQAGISNKDVVDADGQPSDHLLEEDQLGDAAIWISTRISDTITSDFVSSQNGRVPPLNQPFMNALVPILHFLCIDYFEVPFIWVHRRDYFIHHDPTALNPRDRSRALMTREDLWKIYELSIKYRAIQDRKTHLRKLWRKINVDDQYFEELFGAIASLDEVSDLVDYVTLKYSKQLKQLAELADAEIIPEDAEADATRNTASGAKYKRATTSSAYERAKESLVSSFASRMSFSADVLAQRFMAGDRSLALEDPPSAPRAFALEFVDQSSPFFDAEKVIAGAVVILTTEIAKDPMLRKTIRQAFHDYGHISVRPTDLGQQKIDDMHPYYAFKYLNDKPVNMMKNIPQFLQILEAEGEKLVTIDIHIGRDQLHRLTQMFYDVYLSDLQSSDAILWNELREQIIRESLSNSLLPLGASHIRDWLKETEEDYIALRCAAKLEERADMAPYSPRYMAKGEVPKVLAVSHGSGDIKRDFVYTVCLNSKGRLVSYERFEDIRFGDTKEAMAAHIERLKPDVIVIGGFTPSTSRLKEDITWVRDHIKESRLTRASDNTNMDAEKYQAAVARAEIEIIYVYDDVARLFQHSHRATTEFPDVNPIARYCVGVARYAQSPVCEYAALGSDLAAITYEPSQKLVPKDKLLPVLENALVNVVNIIGVDINKAMRDPYYRHLLPFVSGLGPRKANGMVKRINATCGGTLITRADLVKREICTSRVFMNAVAFLRIPATDMEEEDEYDVLDGTRIHNEDYHIARKMAADAEDMDEEDIEDLPHPSGAVSQLMENGAGKLDELSLDEFATALFETQQLLKRLTLYMIRDELQRPYSERRQDFKQPTEQEIFTMLTGETRQTLDLGLILPVVVQRTLPSGAVLCRLDSGIQGIVNSGYSEPDTQYRQGQTVHAQVIAMSLANLSVELSLLKQSIETDDSDRRKTQPDRYYDTVQANMDQQAIDAKSKRAQGRQRRIINHPNFQNFNAGQAEQYLANLQRGDCVIRPSSRGTDHLAVTWKVDDGVYQHVDVLELDKRDEFSLGRQLRIQNKYTYSDLDELIVAHIRAMARKVDEMIHSDKYKGSEELLHSWLSTRCMADPAKSFYGFALDRKKPGNFILSFMTKGYPIQSWGVTVEPDAFVLQGNPDPAPNVTMLCNAFKAIYMTRKAMQGGAQALPARTPYVGGGRTPNPYGGGMTPYGGSRSPFVSAGRVPAQMPQMGMAMPMQGMPMVPQQPPMPMGGAAPSGAYIHPSRLAQQQNGYGR